MFFPLVALLLAFMASAVLAEETDELALSLGLAGDDPVTVSRFPRPVSKIAENVTVITARDIARLNAHTLAEVLQTVPGIHMDQFQTPGSSLFFTVLGMSSRHILVQIDGVPVNFISNDNLSEVGTIPVQMIERVEIIKGAASAAWGSALGGVINISTKAPATEKRAGGMASASIAQHSTSDRRAELSGTADRFGYYMTGGRFRSDGLRAGNGTELNHGFGKFSFELPNDGRLTAGIEVRDIEREVENSAKYDLNGSGRLDYLNGYLALRYPLAERLYLEVNGRGGRREITLQRRNLSEARPLQDNTIRETFQGFTAGLNWGDADTNLSAGVEYENNDILQRDKVVALPAGNFDLALDRWSGYLNGTYTLGRLSLLPGLRFDHTNLLEDARSYTMGATYNLTDSTVLRAYAARGYSMPLINNLEIVDGKRQLQNVWTVQTGLESSAIPYLWLKGTLFYNKVWNVEDFDRSIRAIVRREQIREGVDLELRTSPLYGLALTGGLSYVDARDGQTDAELSGPRTVAKLGLNYDNGAIGLRGALTGNYVHWHQPEFPPKDGAVIWDLHLTQRLFADRHTSAELFFSVRNIFNGSQYQIDLYANNPRWFEAGARYRF